MKINKLRLLNFRCFEEYDIELSNRFTLLIGDNGSGKTAALEALAISAGTFFLNIPNIQISDKDRISEDDIHYEFAKLGQGIIKESSLKHTVIAAHGLIDNQEISWARHRDPEASLISSKNIIDLVEEKNRKKIDSKTFFPVIAYYGTGRLWQKIEEKEIETLGPDSRLVGYQDCLNPASNLEQLFRWFKTQELAALQKNETRQVLEAVRNAIKEMLIPDTKRVWWDVDWDEILIETEIQGKTQTIPFHLLSDGYRNMIGMVADIAYRMATLNPQLEADVIKQTEGIVLIDEIDLHLHPKWQREVVDRLLKTFPKVQFVASSHSPFIIQSLYDREDCLLWDLEKAAPLSIESKSIEDIAENQQGVDIPQQSQRFLDMQKAAEEYYAVLNKIPAAGEAEKQTLRRKLDELSLPYSDDAAFQAFLNTKRLIVDHESEV
jgi:predicted ATP-binding protein involved in virulence